MPPTGSADLADLATFGAFLKYLRRRAKLTQSELAIACGYSSAHISHLESNQRLPDQAALLALIIPALGLENKPDLAERLLELSAAARDIPRPSFSKIVAPNNLPVQPTTFIGRVEELDQIAKLLGESTCRMLTLSGLGGVGKTRLALEAGRHVNNFTHGVCLVSLVAVSSPDFILQAVADAVKFQFQAGGDAKEQLLNYLSDKAILLILDNFEHLIEGADLLSDILNNAPAVKMLITSRIALNRQEEWLMQIQGMGMPGEQDTTSPEKSGAVQLFAERTRRVSPDFELHKHLKAVIRICQLVEGQPLGIELAVSWLTLLTPEEVADEVARSIDFLVTDMPDTPERQRSIRAVFNSSWALLTDEERDVMMRLSLFQAGCSREAAREVGGAPLSILMSLAKKSLIRRDSTQRRYAMHELLRQYAREQLDASEQAQYYRQVYIEYYTNFLRQRDYDIKNRRQMARRGRQFHPRLPKAALSHSQRDPLNA